VIVKSELHACLMNLFLPNIELIGGPLVTVQREPHALGQHRTNDYSTERLAVYLRIKPVIVEVPVGLSVRVIDHAAQFPPGMPIDIPVGLNLVAIL